LHATPSRNLPAVGRKIGLACVAGDEVALEQLARVLPEAVAGAVDQDLVVQRLADEPFLCRHTSKNATIGYHCSALALAENPGSPRARRTVGRDGDRRHRVHAGVGDVLDDDGEAPVPHADSLVVRGGDKAAVLVHKRDRVDGRQVLVVLLNNLARVDVPL